MAVLVAGGAGFLGSHLVDRLLRDGEHVVVADDLSTGRLANLDRALATGQVTFVYVDLAAGREAVHEALGRAVREKYRAVFHLASPASPVAYGSRPWETLAVNGMGTMTLIDFAVRNGAMMLFASTSEAYGDPLVHPQPETYFGNVNPVGPRACYDEGKRFGEAAMSVAIQRLGLDGRIVRIFNCYGPRMDIDDGRLVPSLMAAARDRRPFPVHGDGKQTRSLTYVDDLVEGLVHVAERSDVGTLPVNLGNDDERSVTEIARAVAEVAHVPFLVESLVARPEDPRQRRPDTRRARSLGWSATVPLHEGLRRTYDWLLTDGLRYAS
jgi:nucleoside-diphosphate-sugar epimerase